MIDFMPVICPICNRNDQKSKVYPSESITTQLSKTYYYNEDGYLKSDDPNVTTTKMKCSNGHKFILKEQQRHENIYIE